MVAPLVHSVRPRGSGSHPIAIVPCPCFVNNLEEVTSMYEGDTGMELLSAELNERGSLLRMFDDDSTSTGVCHSVNFG